MLFQTEELRSVLQWGIYIYIYCHVLSDFRRGIGLTIGFIGSQYTSLLASLSAECLLGWAQDLLQTQLFSEDWLLISLF
jgi:hypothetical protein